MSANLSVLGEILGSSFVVLLLLTCALSFIYGVWMLLRPEQALRFNQRISAWVSMDSVSKIMDKPRATERFFYRYHRIYGALMLAGGIFTLYVMSAGRWGRDLTTMFSLSEWSWLVSDVATVLMVMTGFLAAALGITMLIRPSLLRGVEARLNRWISTENSLKPLDSVHYAPDQFVSRHARPVAALIVIGSLYVLVALVPLLRTLL